VRPHVVAYPENPVCEFPKWTERYLYICMQVSKFRLPGDPSARPPVIAHLEISVCEIPKGREPRLNLGC
jgi:hypothetical protein